MFRTDNDGRNLEPRHGSADRVTAGLDRTLRETVSERTTRYVDVQGLFLMYRNRTAASLLPEISRQRA
jgi:hypothetical protein